MMLSDCSAHAACGESFLFSVSVLTTAKTYRIYRQIRPMPLNALYKDCREAWPKTVCGFANVCGDISTTIWFFVLAPQIWKNWRRRSVEGLSILWATANFTASLINCFFAFSGVSLPVYIQISAIYMPVLEFFILVQFWLYSKHAGRMKFFYGAGCCLIWIALIILELSVENAARSVEWIAIVLWSVESFPQVRVVYNILHVQSSDFVLLTLHKRICGKDLYPTCCSHTFPQTLAVGCLLFVLFEPLSPKKNGEGKHRESMEQQQQGTTSLRVGTETQYNYPICKRCYWHKHKIPDFTFWCHSVSVLCIL